ncbi:MATE family efflux transporter [Anaerosporobacter sp.]|uniref:MATE family efflux transporter n=1 Tax=Anaerosporobacter sp. TaxID=1872529 RepID=UPI00286EF8F1|nr:MATE family efflux transporter [Anaerosporobacter sp.]
MKKDREYLLLEEKNIYTAFIYLALPVMLANVLKSFHDLVDTYFVGQMENSVSAQAAISISWPLLNIFMALSMGLAVAGVAVISQYLGAKDSEKAKEYMALLLVLSIGIGIIFNAILYVIIPSVLNFMGAEGEVREQALIYMRVRSFEMPFLFIFTAFQAARQARGDTTTPVILSATAIVINIILTAVFIRGCNMGILGASLSTVIAQIAIVPISLYLMFSKRQELHLTVRDLRFNSKNLSKLIGIALPSAGSEALSSLGFLILQSIILAYGERVAAAFSIGNKISNLLLIPVSALGSVLAAFIGQNVGARNKERAKKAYRASTNVAVAISCIGCLIIYPFREFLLGLLTNDTETLQIAMEYIFWVLATQPLMALLQNYMGVFNGSGNTKYSFYTATARLWVVRLPLILFMKNVTDLGRSGIWYAMVISNFIIVIYAKYLFRKVDFEPKVKM